MSMYSTFGKRLGDIAISLALLITLSPIMGMLALAVLVCLGRPILFRQRRPGLNERTFILLKFRTMIEAADAGAPESDELRLTRLGRFLRASSLDELPELLNVFQGDMSLVGPRPLLVQYLNRYDATQRRRHEIRPGITGLAQVSGRNGLTWERKFELDVLYVDSVTAWLDMKILARTLRAIIRRDGIATSGYATAPEFMGDER